MSEAAPSSLRNILGEEAWFKFRSVMSTRSKQGLPVLAAKGKWPNASPPLGFIKTGDTDIKINYSEGPLVRRIFDMYIRERSAPQVAFILNGERVPAPSRGKWTQSTVQGILTNRLYIGTFSFAGVKKHIERLRLIPDEVFVEANELLNRYKRPGAKRQLMPDERRLELIARMFDKYSDFFSKVQRGEFSGRLLHEAWQDFCKVSGQADMNIEIKLC
jgi:site-specific DNA recombinase